MRRVVSPICGVALVFVSLALPPALAQEPAAIAKHNRWVTSLAWSGDGSQLATVGGESLQYRQGDVKLWDPKTGALVASAGRAADERLVRRAVGRRQDVAHQRLRRQGDPLEHCREEAAADARQAQVVVPVGGPVARRQALCHGRRGRQHRHLGNRGAEGAEDREGPRRGRVRPGVFARRGDAGHLLDRQVRQAVGLERGDREGQARRARRRSVGRCLVEGRLAAGDLRGRPQGAAV